ncbi:hypothetical protein BZA70DRAFT_276281 [Myxozyma melibiosi]|uniref:Rrn9 domain-containing protein n=1 Tax=Myxozyma melibiosi TaxID=54550 RepID=A0ABR1F901_9ASCO
MDTTTVDPGNLPDDSLSPSVEDDIDIDAPSEHAEDDSPVEDGGTIEEENGELADLHAAVNQSAEYVPNSRFTYSRHSEMADFRVLLKTLEHNHRASLAQHLAVAARLSALDQNTFRTRSSRERGKSRSRSTEYEGDDDSGGDDDDDVSFFDATDGGEGDDEADELRKRRRVIHPRWTAWPLPSEELLPESDEDIAPAYDLGENIDYQSISGETGQQRVSPSKRKRAVSSAAAAGNDSVVEIDYEQVFEKERKKRQNDETQDAYDHFRFDSHRFFTPPDYSKNLMTEVSSLGVRTLTTMVTEKREQLQREARENQQVSGDGPATELASLLEADGEDDSELDDIILSNSEMEKSLLLPYLHPHILQMIDGLIDTVATVRKSQAPSSSRDRLSQMDWRDLLSLAALKGMPALDDVSPDAWLRVVESVRDRCETLFSSQQPAPKFEILKNDAKAKEVDLPGQSVKEKHSKKKTETRVEMEMKNASESETE